MSRPWLFDSVQHIVNTAHEFPFLEGTLPTIHHQPKLNLSCFGSTHRSGNNPKRPPTPAGSFVAAGLTQGMEVSIGISNAATTSLSSRIALSRNSSQNETARAKARPAPNPPAANFQRTGKLGESGRLASSSMC